MAYTNFSGAHVCHFKNMVQFVIIGTYCSIYQFVIISLQWVCAT